MADQGTEGLLSPFLRTKRFKASLPYLKGKILDYGCGTGGLAAYVSEENYVGVDVDEHSLFLAKKRFPTHRFISSNVTLDDKFDTIVSLAVIEHCFDAVQFLKNLIFYLNNSDARIVLTTPHPYVNWIHNVGSSIGLFSKHANEEHETLLNLTSLNLIARQAGLKIAIYNRFLVGANQIVILNKIER